MTEKRAAARSTAATKKTADGLNAALDRFAGRIESSNAGLSTAMQESQAFLGEVLTDDQRNRRFWRWILILGMVLNFGLLGALGFNAIEGAKARTKLIDNDAKQEETLRIVQDATSPERQAEGQQQFARALEAVDCNNQRAIQRAMTNLGAPYELTENCQ